ncbi:MAG: hypothetical protein EON95_02735 [Caulobacteraceae bacterium]|nr:MAG: hypothetical protein EON95_02735 [Caulobacteraceae bacterium]
MRPLLIAAALALAPLAGLTTAPQAFAEAKPTQKGGVTVSQLREIVGDLGYTVQDADSSQRPSFEFKITKAGLDIFVLTQESDDAGLIWLKLSFDKLKPGQDASLFLQQTADIYPASFFLYDEGTLGMIVSIENRGITPEIVQSRIDILIEAAISSQQHWLTD